MINYWDPSGWVMAHSEHALKGTPPFWQHARMIYSSGTSMLSQRRQIAMKTELGKLGLKPGYCREPNSNFLETVVGKTNNNKKPLKTVKPDCKALTHI